MAETITGGLINVVPLKRRNQHTTWRRVLPTAYGPVGYNWFRRSWPYGIVDSGEDLWLYVIHGKQEYIGCFRAGHFTPEQIAQTAADFACTTTTH